MTDLDFIFRSFRGIRYAKHDDLSNVIAPPYDVISNEVQSELYRKDENNFVRIELAQEHDRYAAAGETLRRWLETGVLMREAKPALYLLEQEFTVGNRSWHRRGVFGLVALADGQSERVLSHEGTLPGPKVDRLNLIRACRAMTSPIMLMHEDAEGALFQLLNEVKRDPDATARGWDGTVNRLWVISDHEFAGGILQAVGVGPLYIADGHHRFETAMAYRNEMRDLHPDAPPDAGFEYALALVNSAKDDGLRIFPTHRLVSDLDEVASASLRNCMEEHFEIEDEPLGAVDIDAWLAGSPDNGPAFLAYGGNSHLLHLVAKDSAMPRTDSIVRRLDVSVLHERLIDPTLLGANCQLRTDWGISHDSEATGRLGRGPRLTYATDWREVIAAVDRGDYSFAFLVRPTAVGDVMAAAKAGERMPGKSTYFYPKIPAGLVLSDASEESI